MVRSHCAAGAHFFTFNPAEGYRGLVKDRPTVVILASGSDFVTGMNRGRVDMATPYLRDILRFIGVHNVRFVAVGPTIGPRDQVDAARDAEPNDNSVSSQDHFDAGWERQIRPMMGEGRVTQEALFYGFNYLIDLKHAVIMDVEVTTAIRQAEVGAAKTMLDRTAEQFDLTPLRLVADGSYGSAEMVGWLVDERDPAAREPDRQGRAHGWNLLPRADFAFDRERNLYVCPGGKELRKYHCAKPRDGLTKERRDDLLCAQAGLRGLRAQAQVLPERSARKIARSVHEAARDKARAIARTDAYAVSRRERKKVEMLFAHLKRILRLDRLRLRGPSGAEDEFLLSRHGLKSAETGEAHSAPGADLRHMRPRGRNPSR